MVATLIIYVIAWITTHLPTLEGWKAEFYVMVLTRPLYFLKKNSFNAIELMDCFIAFTKNICVE